MERLRAASNDMVEDVTQTWQVTWRHNFESRWMPIKLQVGHVEC